MLGNATHLESLDESSINMAVEPIQVLDVIWQCLLGSLSFKDG